MKITKRIKFALQRAVDEAGNRNRLAIKVGVVQGHIARWLDGTTQSIDDNLYDKLFPHIKPFFKEWKGEIESIEFDSNDIEQWDSECKKTFLTGITDRPNPDELAAKHHLFPVVSEAAAAECSGNIFMPLVDCIEENAEDERVSFPCGKPGDFAIRVSGTSMMPWYPPGTLLLVRPNERIQTGKRVVAILDNGDVIFKVFIESKTNIGLVSIDDGGKDYVFAKTESKHEIRSLFRVIASMRVEDDVDTAMSEAGIHHRWEDKLKNLDNPRLA